MATGQGILDTLSRSKKAKAERRGALPLIAFYGRESEQERRRNRFYHELRLAMSMPEAEADALPDIRSRRSLLFIDLNDSIAILDVNASPLEFVASRGEMETEQDDDGMAGVRFHTALRMRDLVDGAQVKGMRSPALEGSGGGGGGASVDIPAYRLDCMGRLRRIRSAMADGWISRLVEDVVVGGVWFNLRPTEDASAAEKADREATLRALHYGLDVAGVTLGHMAARSFRVRWPQGAPPPPAIFTRRIKREDMVRAGQG